MIWAEEKQRELVSNDVPVYKGGYNQSYELADFEGKTRGAGGSAMRRILSKK